MNKVAKNASWIIVCRIVQALLGLIINMITARYFGPSNFGLLTYASSLVAFVTPLMQLGFNNTLVQELINDPENEGKYLGTSMALSSFSAFFCIISITVFSLVANPNEKETIYVCFLYSLLLIFQALELISFWFQANYISKYHSIVSLVAYFIVSLYKLYLLFSHKSIYWFAISNCLDYLIISISIIIIYLRLGGKRLCFSISIAKSMFSSSKHYIVSDMMVTVFAQTDKIMLKQMIADSATGYYGAAIQCAGMASFVFAAIINSFRPSIFESKLNNQIEYETKIKLLYNIVIYFSLFLCLCAVLFSRQLILIMYGSDYSPAIVVLRIVVWYTTFSYLGSIRNIWILAEEKQKYLWIINLSGALFNVVFNLLLIPRLGIVGAAIASLATQIFTNVIIGFIIIPLRRNNVLMMESIHPKYIKEMIYRLKD